jgi:hypothetical protein
MYIICRTGDLCVKRAVRSLLLRYSIFVDLCAEKLLNLLVPRNSTADISLLDNLLNIA